MELKNRLQYFSKLFTFDQINEIAYALAARLTLDQRAVIMKITTKELQMFGTPEFLSELFGETVPCKLKAEVDLKTIEAIMLTVEEENIKIHAMEANFAELFATELASTFSGFQRMVDLSPAVKPDEYPEQMFLKDPFMLVDKYFEEPDPPLPKAFLERQEDMSDCDYLETVRRFLKLMDQVKF